MARWLWGSALAATLAIAGVTGCANPMELWARSQPQPHPAAPAPGVSTLPVPRSTGTPATVPPPSATSPSGASPTPEAADALRVIAPLPLRSRSSALLVDYRVEGARGSLVRLELWVTPNGGAHWRLLAADHDRTPPLEAKFEDGEWGIRWVAVDAERRGDFPQPGDSPAATIVIDTAPPEIVFDDERVWLESNAREGERYGIHLPVAVTDPNLDPAAGRAELSIGGGGWRRVSIEDGILRAEAPVSPARLRVRVSASDTFGHTASREKEIRPADRIDPPRIAFVEPPSEWVAAGGVLRLAWEGSWPALPAASATLEFRGDGGDWSPIACGLPATGSHPWRIPRIVGERGELRIRLEGGAQRERIPADTIPVRIDAMPPSVRIVAPAAGSGPEIPLIVETEDSGGSGVVALSLWRWGGGRWALLSERPTAPAFPYHPGVAGEHRLWLVARDAAGLESAPPPADPALAFRLAVTEETRAIELFSFQQGGSFLAGGRHLVFFRTSGGDLAATVVHLEWSDDDGATWSRRATVPARSGRVELVLPRSGVELARVRVIAEEAGGAPREARSAVPFRVDVDPRAFATVDRTSPTTRDTAPEAGPEPGQRLDLADAPLAAAPAPSAPAAPAEPAATVREVATRSAPEDPEGSPAVELAAPLPADGGGPIPLLTGPSTSRGRYTTFGVRPGAGVGAERLEAWVRPASAAEWRRVAEARPGRPLVAELADGLYHVAIVAVSAAGGRSEPPSPGEPGDGTLLVDTVPPVLHVDETGDRSRFVRRGGALRVNPRVTDLNLSAFPLSFRAIEDGALEGSELKRYHPNATEFAWTLPLRPGVHTLEVIAEDIAGNRAIQRIPAAVIPGAPEIRFLSDPAGAILAAGDEIELAWQGAGVEPEWRGVTIEFAADGETWVVFAVEEPADARTTWRAPAVDSDRCRLRVTITGPDGLRGSAESGPFTITSSAPSVRTGGIRPAGGE